MGWGSKTLIDAAVTIFMICLIAGLHAFRWQGVNSVAMCDRQYIDGHHPACRVPSLPDRMRPYQHYATQGRHTNARTDTTALPAFATSPITPIDSAPVT